jgi:hypothetical protein
MMIDGMKVSIAEMVWRCLLISENKWLRVGSGEWGVEIKFLLAKFFKS